MKLKIKDQIPDTEIFHFVDGESQKNKLREILGKDKIILPLPKISRKLLFCGSPSTKWKISVSGI